MFQNFTLYSLKLNLFYWQSVKMEIITRLFLGRCDRLMWFSSFVSVIHSLACCYFIQWILHNLFLQHRKEQKERQEASLCEPSPRIVCYLIKLIDNRNENPNIFETNPMWIYFDWFSEFIIDPMETLLICKCLFLVYSPA